MINARLVNMGEIDSNLRMASWQLSRYKNYDNPLIIVNKVEKDTLSILGNQPFSEFINIEKIPKEFEVVRYKTGKRSGVLFYDKGTITFRIFYPATKIGRIVDKFIQSVIEILWEDYKVRVFRDTRRINSNDIVFEKDGKIKKFCGIMNEIKENIFACVFTLNFGGEKIDGLYKLNHEKFKRKGDIKEITDVVGGLNEINPEIGEDVVGKIIESLGKKLDWKIENSEFYEEENIIINKFIDTIQPVIVD